MAFVLYTMVQAIGNNDMVKALMVECDQIDHDTSNIAYIIAQGDVMLKLTMQSKNSGPQG